MNTEHFKQKLEEELKLVDKELAENARPDIDQSATEKDEVADRFEAQEESGEESMGLKVRRDDIEAALEKIKNGTYGKCEVSGEPIEEERLDANPAARTCEKHLK
jgi:RNA polymerase-binding transcription factor DksA